MDLPNLLNKLKIGTEETKKFIAIEICFDAVKTAIWQSTGAHTEVVSVGSVQSWQTTNTDDLITAIDTSLSEAQAGVNEEPDQVIFGLPETWVDDDGISETKKVILKQICQKFDLKAIGFVVTTEAMVHHLRDVEGGPPSAILIQASSGEVAVSLIYLGKLEATHVVLRSTKIAADVEEGLARIPHTGHLPSRMIVMTNSEDVESLKQDLISYEWQKKLEFLHIPKIESFTKDWSIKAVSIAGGSEVVENLGFNNLNPTISDKKTVEAKENKEEKAEEVKKETVEFGFTPVAVDQLENETDSYIEKEETLITKADDNLEETVLAEIPPQISSKSSKNILGKLLLGFGNRAKSLIKKPSKDIDKPTVTKKKWLIPLGILVFLIILSAAGVAAYMKFPEANLDVYISLNPYQQPLTFTVDPAATGNLESLAVSGQKSEIEKSGTKTQATTGSKTVGDRAKGKVAVYNRTTSPRTLTAGTVIRNNSLRFTLDTSVTIASASTKENSDFSVTTEPSKAEVNVTAADIGEQYNLASGIQFMVANFASDNFIATSITGFTGGTANKIAAVSKEDQDSIKKALIQELQDEIGQSLSPGEADTIKTISVGDPIISNEKFSNQIGDEADSLSLEMTLSQTVYQIDGAEVSLLAQQAAASALPDNVQLKPDSTKINILNTIIEEDKAKVEAQVVLQYIPKIETTDISRELTGLPINQIGPKLQALPNYQNHELKSKWLIFNRLPFNQSQIVVHLKPVAKTE